MLQEDSFPANLMSTDSIKYCILFISGIHMVHLNLFFEYNIVNMW